MSRVWICLMLLSAMVAGCAGPPAMLNNGFDPAAAAFINQAGTSAISGQGFLRTMVGEVRYAAGSEVILIPVTPYSSERMQAIYAGGKCSKYGKSFKNDDTRFKEFTKHTKANGEGRFKFSNLTAGNYYVVTSVYWNVPGNYIPEGCGIYEQVSIAQGETKEVIISGD